MGSGRVRSGARKRAPGTPQTRYELQIAKWISRVFPKTRLDLPCSGATLRGYATVPRMGVEKGSRCESGAVPATVSGEPRSAIHWGSDPWEGGSEAETREPGDLPSYASCPWVGSCPWRGIPFVTLRKWWSRIAGGPDATHLSFPFRQVPQVSLRAGRAQRVSVGQGVSGAGDRDGVFPIVEGGSGRHVRPLPIPTDSTAASPEAAAFFTPPRAGRPRRCRRARSRARRR